MNMEDEIYLDRIIDSKIQTYLECFGAISLEGPKWCGKTRTAMHNSKSEIFLSDPRNNFNNRQVAMMNPFLVLKGDFPRLIDEWQVSPQIWDAVRHEVDFNNQKGMFILTGSATPKRSQIFHSGAGRIASIKMRTMSLFETHDSSGIVSLKDMCEGKDIDNFTGDVSLYSLASYIIRGGWPANIKIKKENQHLLPREYIKTIIENEIFTLTDSKYNAHKMMLLLKSLARNESATPSINKLINDIKINDDDKIDGDTIRKYLQNFESMYLIDNQLPFSFNTRSSLRVKQKEKFHFCDPSLSVALLNLNESKLFNDLETFGLLFESLVIHDLRIYADCMNASLYHYQDYAGNEFDAVIQLENGEYVAVEVKLGANTIEEASKKLIKIKNQIIASGGKPPKEMIIISGLSSYSYKTKDGIYVAPLTALKP